MSGESLDEKIARVMAGINRSSSITNIAGSPSPNISNTETVTSATGAIPSIQSKPRIVKPPKPIEPEIYEDDNDDDDEDDDVEEDDYMSNKMNANINKSTSDTSISALSTSSSKQPSIQSSVGRAISSASISSDRPETLEEKISRLTNSIGNSSRSLKPSSEVEASRKSPVSTTSPAMPAIDTIIRQSSNGSMADRPETLEEKISRLSGAIGSSNRNKREAPPSPDFNAPAKRPPSPVSIRHPVAEHPQSQPPHNIISVASDRSETLEEKIARLTGSSSLIGTKSTGSDFEAPGKRSTPIINPSPALPAPINRQMSSSSNFSDRPETLEEKIARVTGAINSQPSRSDSPIRTISGRSTPPLQQPFTPRLADNTNVSSFNSQSNSSKPSVVNDNEESAVISPTLPQSSTYSPVLVPPSVQSTYSTASLLSVQSYALPNPRSASEIEASQNESETIDNYFAKKNKPLQGPPPVLEPKSLPTTTTTSFAPTNTTTSAPIPQAATRYLNTNSDIDSEYSNPPLSTSAPSVSDKNKRSVSGGGKTKPRKEETNFVAPASGGLVTDIKLDPPKLTRSVSRERLLDNSRPKATPVKEVRSISAGRRQNTRESPPTNKFTPQHRRMPDVNTALSRVTGRSPESNHNNNSRLSFNDWSLLRQDQDGDDMSNNDSESNRAVQVAIRVRPFTVGEIQSGPRRVVSVNGDKLILVNPTAFEADPDTIAAAAAAVSLGNMRCSDWAKVFRYDHCFWSYDPSDEGDTYADQLAVHEAIGKTIVSNILKGKSSACFSYGHTGTGKTHTMFGSVVPALEMNLAGNVGGASSDFSDNNSDRLSKLTMNALPSEAGLIQRVFSDIIEAITSNESLKSDTVITMSFMEVYNEKIHDLLNPDGNHSELRVREHPEVGAYVENLSKIEVRSANEARKLLFSGHVERATAQTSSNTHSSRSHAVVTLELSPVGYEPPIFQTKKPTPRIQLKASHPPPNAQPYPTDRSARSYVRLQMVDLAGSEKEFSNSSARDNNEFEDDFRSSSAHGARKSTTGLGQTEKLEMKMIRLSLSTLGCIIKALGQGSTTKGLPYRDSVLTWLLKDSLGGNSCTTMVATVSPSHTCYDETLNTLKYADRLCSYSRRVRGVDGSGRVAIGDTIDPQLSMALTSEYNRLRNELGAGKPGSKASKMLYKQILNDPQQRLAKLELANREYQYGNQSASASNSRASSPLRGTFHGADIVPDGASFREQYRVIHGQLVEMQIELEAARTDRDSLQVELQALREAGAAATPAFDTRRFGNSGRSAVFELSEALKVAEREVAELRGLCIRKEQDIDRFVQELAEERQARTSIEKSTRSQTADLITRMEVLQRQSNASTQEMYRAQNELSQMKELRDSVIEENERLKHESNASRKQIETKIKDMENLLRQSHDALRQSQEALKQPHEAWRQSQEALKQAQDTIKQLQDSLRNSQELLRQSQDNLAGVTRERNELRSLFEEFEKYKNNAAIRESTLKLQFEEQKKEMTMQLQNAQQMIESRMISDMTILKNERDSLLMLVNQKDQEMRAYQQQSETAIKMLNQRQAALADMENRHANSENGSDELTRLQDTLQAWLSREGKALHSGLLDAKRLTATIASIRRKYEDVTILSDKLNMERFQRQQAEQQLKELRGAMNKAGIGSPGGLQADRQSQELDHYKKKAAEWEANAMYWQQLIKKTNSYVTGLPLSDMSLTPQESQLRAEITKLKDALQKSENDVKQAKQDHEASKEESQREFASLWLAVQELNKMDALKESTIREVTEERDRMLNEKKELQATIQKLSTDYETLQKELQDIDLELLDAVDAEGIPMDQLPSNAVPLSRLRQEIPRDLRSPTRISKKLTTAMTPPQSPMNTYNRSPMRSGYPNTTSSASGGASGNAIGTNRNNQTRPPTSSSSSKQMYSGKDTTTTSNNPTTNSNINMNSGSTNKMTMPPSDQRGVQQGMERQVEVLEQFLKVDRERSRIQNSTRGAAPNNRSSTATTTATNRM